MAADEIHGGNTLRKIIDYFSHLAVAPNYFDYIKDNDTSFATTPYLKKLEWLKDDKETVYDPKCDDVIRVAFMHKLKRAKLANLANLVQLLTGRDFETREFKEEIVEDTFNKMYEGVQNVISQHNFTQFMIAIKSACFISDKMVTSNMALDLAYTIHLLLQDFACRAGRVVETAAGGDGGGVLTHDVQPPPRRDSRYVRHHHRVRSARRLPLRKPPII